MPRLYLGLAAHGRAQHDEAHRQFASAGELATLNPDVFPEVLESYLATGDKSLAGSATRLVESTKSVELSLRTAAVLDRYGCVKEAYQVYRPLWLSRLRRRLFTSLWRPLHPRTRTTGMAWRCSSEDYEVIPASAALHFHHGLLSALEGKREQAIGDFAKAAVGKTWVDFARTRQGSAATRGWTIWGVGCHVWPGSARAPGGPERCLFTCACAESNR